MEAQTDETQDAEEESVESLDSTDSIESAADDPFEGVVDDPVVQNEMILEAREVALQIARSVMSWTAPLPRPEDLKAYKDTLPTLAEAIEQAYRTQADHVIAFATREQEFTVKELDLSSRNMTIREKESESDIQIRNRNQIFGMAFVIIVLTMGFVYSMWGPENGSIRAIITLGFLSPIVIIPGIMMLRGRMSTHEQKAISSVAPHFGRPTALAAPKVADDEQ